MGRAAMIASSKARHLASPAPRRPGCSRGFIHGLLATLTLTACIPSESPTLQRGDPAPVFTATSLASGSPVSLTDYLGETLLVNLWATWCHPCRAETPYLQSVYERYRHRGLRILGVSVDRRADYDAVIEFVEEFGVEYDIALDPDAVSRDIFPRPRAAHVRPHRPGRSRCVQLDRTDPGR